MKLPIDVRYRILPPTRVERMLTAVQADYPPASLTAALAEALSAVLHVCDRHHAIGQTTVPVRVVAEALAPPLNAFLQPWADDEPGPAVADRDSLNQGTVRDAAHPAGPHEPVPDRARLTRRARRIG